MELDTVGQRRAWQQVIPGSVSILLAIGTSVPSKKSRNKKLGKAHEKGQGKATSKAGGWQSSAVADKRKTTHQPRRRGVLKPLAQKQMLFQLK